MDPVDLAFAGPLRQAELVRGREVSARELVDLYLDRIERLDPDLHAYRVVLADQARADAEAADGRVAAGEEAPLLGVPIAIKDNMHVRGEFTGHGSAGHGGPEAEDSEHVRRLREAGAIVLGKTHLPELAIWPMTEPEAHGKTHNPWDRNRSAGGSSGGSGAAVAAGLAAAAAASDGGGSIRIPASCCGLVGLKPQRGRVSLMPDAEHWYGLSVVGSVTRTVADTALWLDVVAGPAEGDADRAEPPERPFLESARTPPGKLRIVVSTKSPVPLVKVSEPVERGVAETAEVLRSLGHEVVERDPDYPDVRPSFIPRWMRGISDEADAVLDTNGLEPRTRRLIAMAHRIGDRGLAKARAREAGMARKIAAIFDQCDVLVTPTITHPPHELGRYDGRGAVWTIMGAANTTPFTVPWNTVGLPAMSVPAPSLHEGLPIGVQLAARANGEATLISLAAQLEAEVGWPERRPPVD